MDRIDTLAGGSWPFFSMPFLPCCWLLVFAVCCWCCVCFGCWVFGCWWFGWFWLFGVFVIAYSLITVLLPFHGVRSALLAVKFWYRKNPLASWWRQTGFVGCRLVTSIAYSYICIAYYLCQCLQSICLVDKKRIQREAVAGWKFSEKFFDIFFCRWLVLWWEVIFPISKIGHSSDF